MKSAILAIKVYLKEIFGRESENKTVSQKIMWFLVVLFLMSNIIIFRDLLVELYTFFTRQQ
nr:hypothetical protein [uncultured bacterium]